MASGIHKNHVLTCMFVLVAFSRALSIRFVDGNKTSEGENGDAFECVDMYKQPAFSHPLLKNHTIQIRPSSYPNGLNARNNTQPLLKECPEGTVPIRRTLLNNNPEGSPVTPNSAGPRRFGLLGRETAQVYVQTDIYQELGAYQGAQGTFNVWNPKVTGNGEFSSAKILLSSLVGFPSPNKESIEAGWHVFPGDKQPKFYVFWTGDNYKNTGCYNLECPGFVQTSKIFAVGYPLHPISTYGGVQYQMQITIEMDRASGDWWVRKDGEDIGYRPNDIFRHLGRRSFYVSWGGEVFNSGMLSNGKHTSTQMGSGHFPGEGFSKAAYISHLGVLNEMADVQREPANLTRFVTKASCYDMQLGKKGDRGFGTHIYFGGPGYSVQCP